MDPQFHALTYRQRLDMLRATKLEHARRKVELTGPRDADEQGNVPPPPELTEVVEAVSGSGVPVKALVLNNYEPASNHPSGGFFGAKALNVLPTLSQDVDNGMLHYLESARSTKQGLLHPVAKGLIYIGIAANGVDFLAGRVFFIMALTGGGVLGILLAGAMMLFSGVIIWVLASWLRTVPEFMRRLERKILK